VLKYCIFRIHPE